MPRISEFYGIVIYRYFQDHNPPHFHAMDAEDEALVRIDTGEILRGQLPATARNLVEQWRRLHVDELASNWARAQEPVALMSVDPLQ